MDCWGCDGSGYVTREAKTDHGVDAVRVRCTVCEGTGRDPMPNLDDPEIPEIDSVQG